VIGSYAESLVLLAPGEFVVHLRRPEIAARLEAPRRQLLLALAERRLGHLDAARAAFDSLRLSAEKALRDSPGNRSEEWNLARGLAGVGRGEEALALARKRAANRWDKVDRFGQFTMQRYIAEIAVLAGRRAEAIEALDQSFGIPLWTTPAFLRVDPRFEALHGDPRFEAMLARHAKLPELPDP
jgi:tetratricopeptide (TPR) repeat protein